MAQGSPSEQLPDSQAHTSPLGYGKPYDDINRACVLTPPEPAEKQESKVDTIGASDHNNIYGDLDAIHIAPKSTVSTPKSQGRRTTGNTYYILPKPAVPTPTRQGCQAISNAYIQLTPTDFSARRSPMPSPFAVSSLASPAGFTSPQFAPHTTPLPSSLPSGAKRRQMPSEPSPLSQSSKRQRVLSRPVLPSQEVSLLHVKMEADPSPQSETQGPQIPPASVEGLALSLSRNEPVSGEKIDGNHAVVRHSKGAGLRINTKVAELAAPLLPGNETTSGEKLYADYVKTHNEFRRELDNLTHELDAATKRADAAELRIKKAENMVYQANNASFSKLRTQQDRHKKEHETQQRENRSLMTKCYALERSIDGKNEEIDELKWALGQERQMAANVRSELSKAVENLGFGPLFK